MKEFRKLCVGIVALLFATLAYSSSQNSFSELSTTMDTVNQVNAEGKKYGHWIIYGYMKKDQTYADDSKVEEGRYQENKRTGLWKKYFPSGKIRSEITYKRNIPNGKYKLYYASGQVEEQGHWKNSRNIKDFKRFHQNGKVSQEFTFADNGKRNGEQRYYHENGQLELQVNIIEGKEQGKMVRFYANGDVKEEKVFNNGIVDEASIKKFEPKKPEVVVEETPEVPVKVTTAPVNDKTNVEVFKRNGRNTLYNKNMQISQSGVFKNGKLWDGKWYRYNRDGILENIEVYRKGKYIGDAVIEED